MRELELRKSQFNSVQDQGESLVMSRHPAAKTIEAYTTAMQTQWSWLLQVNSGRISHENISCKIQNYELCALFLIC